ncbi:MAG: SDR family oxidoreductase [Hyphomonadaceae bacterium]|nr:SDR family oxidoreductase [Hyphomonadaceae bacterium]
MTKALEARVALVTGGGQGVGHGIARALAGAGADVVIAQRTTAQGEQACAEIARDFGVESMFVAADVTKRDQVEAMVQAVVSRFGRLDILVNNAGGSFSKRLENHSDEDMAAAFDLNYWSAFYAMRAAFPIMRTQTFGRIINVGSLNGVNAHMFTAAYNASKEAVRALTRTAAVEWGRHGITANVICPSAASPQAKAYFDANPDMLQTIVDQVPVGRIGEAESDIGPAAVFLASPQSAYFTGNTLFIDGGAHLNGVAWRPAVED